MTLHRFGVPVLAAALLSLAAPSAPAAGNPPAAPSGSAPSAAQRTEAAERMRTLYFEGRLDELEKECLALLHNDPADVEARISLANVYRKRGVDRDVEWEVHSLGPGQKLPGAEFLARASTELKTVLEAAPERRDVWFGLCQIERERRDIPGLVSCSTSVLDRFPDDPDLPADLLSNVRPLVEREEYADTVSALEPVAQRKPRDRDVQIAWGRSLYLAGRREEGLAALNRLGDVMPDDGELQYQRAELTAFQGDFATAGVLFARASRLKVRQGLPHLGVIASAHTYDAKAAIQLLRNTLNRWKLENNRTADKVSISVVASMRQFDGVLAAIPPSAQDTFLFAQELVGLGCPAAALGETIAAIRLDSQLADAYVLQAALRSNMQQHDQALALLAQALKALDGNPDRPYGVTRDEITLAMVREQLRLGKYEDALANCRKLSKPEEHAWQAALANERLGRMDEAAKLLKRVVESGTDTGEVEQARRRLAAPPYASPAP